MVFIERSTLHRDYYKASVLLLLLLLVRCWRCETEVGHNMALYHQQTTSDSTYSGQADGWCPVSVNAVQAMLHTCSYMLSLS
jgi:hypothetical protein